MLVDCMVSRLSNVRVRFVVLNESIIVSAWLERHRRGKRRFRNISLGALDQSSRRRTIEEAMRMCPGRANDPRGKW